MCTTSPFNSASCQHPVARMLLPGEPFAADTNVRRPCGAPLWCDGKHRMLPRGRCAGSCYYPPPPPVPVSHLSLRLRRTILVMLTSMLNPPELERASCPSPLSDTSLPVPVSLAPKSLLDPVAVARNSASPMGVNPRSPHTCTGSSTEDTRPSLNSSVSSELSTPLP